MKYHCPPNLESFLELIRSLESGRFTILAGGTDLVPRFENGVHLPDHLVDLKKIQEINGIVEKPDGIEIGALTTIETMRKSPLIRQSCQSLWQAASDFAGPQIRHRATIGGNICNASPAGDTIPPLFAHKAVLSLVGIDGERTVPVDSFFTGPGKTALRPGELLKSIKLAPQSDFSCFEKLGLRAAMAISVVNFAMNGWVENGRFVSLGIAAGAVAPTVVRLQSFANALLESSDGMYELDKIIDLVDDDISPISDIRAGAEYRRQVLKNLLKNKIYNYLSGES